MEALFVGGLAVVGVAATVAAALIGIGFFRATAPRDDGSEDPPDAQT